MTVPLLTLTLTLIRSRRRSRGHVYVGARLGLPPSPPPALHPPCIFLSFDTIVALTRTITPPLPCSFAPFDMIMNTCEAINTLLAQREARHASPRSRMYLAYIARLARHP